MPIYDVIIIVGGPACYTAALYATRAGLNTLVLERISAGGQLALTGDVDNYPGFDEGIDGFTLGMKMQSSAERFGAVTEYAEVLHLEKKEKIKKIITDSGEFAAKAIIVATGANPSELGLPREAELTGKGIHYCAHCDGRFYKDKTAVVVGGGNSAVSDALYLAHLAKKVYLIHRRDTLRATKVYHEPLLRCENVEFLWNSRVVSPIMENRITGIKVENLKTGETSELSCDGLFVSVGRSPSTELFRGQLALDGNGYIVADETTKTSVEGVFAAGDVRTKILRQVVTAAADGAVAAHFAEEYIAQK